MSDDTISRQAAIDVLRRKMDKTAKGEIGAFYNTIIRQDIECIEQLPSAERRGRWIFDIDNKEWSWDKPYVCDQCGEWVEKVFKFCPNCGANMEGEGK